MPVRVDRTADIEKALTSVYLKLFADIKHNEQYPADVTFLKAQYNRKVYDASRKAITEVFNEGHNYVGRELGVEAFMSGADVDAIKRETDRAVATFWRRLEADSRRAIEIQQQENRLIVEDKSDPFDTDFFLQNAALIATTGALAISTLSKTNQIVSDPELGVDKPTITWRTQMDERVCPICNALDGQVWPYDDVTIPVPGRNGPSGTHGNCRCYLELG